MHVTTRSAIGALSVAALAGSAIGGVSAFGHNDNSQGGKGNHGRHNGQTLFRSALAPTVLSDPTIHGQARGGAPWVLDRGQVRLRHDGRLKLSVRGLIIPTLGNAGPVTSITASLYCGADADAAVATTGPAPLSQQGDGTIRDRIALPAKCLAPIILVHPNGSDGAYIAASGFETS
jgi:hypothetical protein